MLQSWNGYGFVIPGGGAIANRRGFNLLEAGILLVVLVVLVVVLFPVIARARRRAEVSGCLVNLRRIGQATRLYMQDWDETFPMAWGPAAQGQRHWTDDLAPYLRSVSRTRSGVPPQELPPLHCPADRLGPSRVSYAVNALLSGAGSDPLDPPERLAGVEAPAKVVWAGETTKLWSRKGGFYDTVTDWVRPAVDLGYSRTDDRTVAFYRRWLKDRDWTDLQATALNCPDGLYQCKYPAFRHGRKGERTGWAGFVFIDGHVRSCRWGELNVENFFPRLTERQLRLYNR